MTPDYPAAAGRPMYDAKCAKCGAQTQVPFQPSGDRPVYCDSCFREERQNRGAPRRERPMYDATCSACGKETKVPFQPSGDRPVYCLDCFRKERG